MCMGATCEKCSKKTWIGCGLHIPRVMDTIPQAEWCTCEPKVKADGGKEYPPGVKRAARTVW